MQKDSSENFGFATPRVPDSRERRRITKAPTYDRAPLSVPGRACRAGEGTPFLSSSKIETRSSTVAFSPDGRTFASGDDNGVQVYDCDTRAILQIYRREYARRPWTSIFPQDHVSAVAFSAAGALLFTTVCGTRPNMSGPVLLYNAPDMTVGPREISRRELDLFGLGTGIRKTEFSPDGSLLAVVGSNSNVALYDVAAATRRLVPRRVPPS